MGVLGLLLFAVKTFLHFLAWPLLALGYPLCASIKAIESNSVFDTQKLNTYWVVFSLALLFEHAFVKLLQWFPFWPYIRLVIVCWLVIPNFDGASYVYKYLICSGLSLDLQIVINWFNKRMESSFKRQKLVAEVERFVKENGTEALEKLIASKPGGMKNLKVDEIKAVSCIEKEGSQEEPNLVRTENRIVATGKTKETVAQIAAGREVIPQTSASKPLQKEWKQKKLNACKVSLVEPNIVQTENQVSSTVETTETVAEVAPGGELHQASTSICHVTVHCESDFNSHLQGKRHKKIVVAEAMKATNQTVIPETVPSYTMKKSESPKEESGNSTKNETNLLEIIPSNISKKSDANSAKNQTVQPNVVVSYIPKQSYQLTEASGSGWNVPMIPRETSGWDAPMIPREPSGWDAPIPREVSGWDASMIARETSGWDAPMIPNTPIPREASGWDASMIPRETSGWDALMIPRETSGWDIPIIPDAAMIPREASGWDAPMIPRETSGWDASMFPHQASGWDRPMFPYQASGWDIPMFPRDASACNEGKTTNIWASSSATKPGKLKEEKVERKQWCSVCKVRCSSKLDMDSHLRGRKHLNRVQLSGGV
ncbi:hypothetical protein UlMin_033555 [Ulmus minor]